MVIPTTPATAQKKRLSVMKGSSNGVSRETCDPIALHCLVERG